MSSDGKLLATKRQYIYCAIKLNTGTLDLGLKFFSASKRS